MSTKLCLIMTVLKPRGLRTVDIYIYSIIFFNTQVIFIIFWTYWKFCSFWHHLLLCPYLF